MSISRDDWEHRQFELASGLIIGTRDFLANNPHEEDAALATSISRLVVTSVYGEKPAKSEEAATTPPCVFNWGDFDIGKKYEITTKGRGYIGVANAFIGGSLILTSVGGRLGRVIIHMSDITAKEEVIEIDEK